MRFLQHILEGMSDFSKPFAIYNVFKRLTFFFCRIIYDDIIYGNKVFFKKSILDSTAFTPRK